MMLVRIALAAAVCFCAPAAVAECSDDTLQLMANRLDALRSDLATGPIAAALKDDLSACQGEPAAHKIASLAYAQMAARERTSIDAALGYADLAVREAFRTSLAVTAGTPTRFVFDGNNQRVQIQFNDLHQLGKQAVELMLQAELKSGKAAPITGPARAGDPPMKCDVTASSMVQHAAYWMKSQKTLTPGGPAFMEKLISLCPADNLNGLDARAYRASLMLTLLEATPTPPNSAELMRQAVADSDAIFAQKPEGLYIGWRASDRDRLRSQQWKVAMQDVESLALTEWFQPGRLGRPETAMAIAAQLDAAYALDMTEQGASRLFKRYREIISNSYAAILKLPAPQQREARKMVFLAATKHAAGEWRRDENKALKPPMAILYNWVDPDYTPPAAPASTQ